LNFTINSSALMGEYQDIHAYNRSNTKEYNHKVYSFVRWSETEKLIIVTNFDQEKEQHFKLQIPTELISSWRLNDGEYGTKDVLYDVFMPKLKVKNQEGIVEINLKPLESFVLKLDI